MAFTGGYSPGPMRTGGGTTRLQRIIESLESGRGSAYSTDPNSTVFVENMAIARAIDQDGYGCNERLANNFLPLGMTAAGLLPRWERIFGLYAAPGTTEPVRRARVAAMYLRIGQPNDYQSVLDAVTAALGPVFVAILHQDLTNAVIWWPVAPNPNAFTPWYSSIAHIAIQVVQPAGMTTSQFYNAVASLGPILDTLLPAWTTWDWFRLNVLTGTKGIYLDRALNLDNNVFDV